MSEAAVADVRGPAQLRTGGTVRVRECKHGLMCYFPHDTFIGRALDVYGEYSEHEAALFASLLKPGMCVIEVGANIGALTLPIAKLVGPSGRVFAYEPQRILFQMLCANLSMNGIWNTWARQEGVGAFMSTMGVPPVNYAIEGNFGSVELKNETPEMVPIVALDCVELPPPHLIKIDCEGMELSVIEGASKIIDKHRPVLFVENDREEKSADLVAAIRLRKYDLWWHVSTLFNGNNWRGEKRDIFVTEDNDKAPAAFSSFNMLCVPSELQMKVHGLLKVEPNWQSPGGYIRRMAL